MSLKISCPNCAKAFPMKAELQGKKVRCPKCKTHFIVDISPQTASSQTKTQKQAAEPPVATIVPKVVDPIPVVPAQVAPNSASPAAAKLAPAAVAASPYESLASDLMTTGSPAASGQSKDYLAINRRLKQHQQGSRADVDHNSMRFLFRGVSLMLFGLLLLGLAFLGLRFSGISSVSPTGALIGAACGSLGSIMVIVGLHRRIGSALFFGAVPGLFFVAAIGLVVTLFYRGYWDSPFDNMPGFASFNSSLSPEARNALKQADKWNKEQAERNRKNSSRRSNPAPVKPRVEPKVAPSDPPERPSRSPVEDDPFAEFRNSNPPTQPTSPPVKSETLFSGDGDAARKPIDDDNPFGRATTGRSNSNSGANSVNRRTANSPPEKTENKNREIDPFTDPVENASRPSGSASSSTSPNNRVSTVPFPKFGGTGMTDLARRQGVIRSEMFKKYKAKAIRDFPPELLTELVGSPRGSFETYLVKGDNLPLLGLDAINTMRDNGLYTLVPVYSANENSVTFAKSGYAIGGLNVHAQGGAILGFQCVFMKLDGNQLDPQDFYLGDWIGARPADGKGVLLAGDGRTVYGVWFEGGSRVGALGLIRAGK